MVSFLPNRNEKAPIESSRAADRKTHTCMVRDVLNRDVRKRTKEVADVQHNTLLNVSLLYFDASLDNS